MKPRILSHILRPLAPLARLSQHLSAALLPQDCYLCAAPAGMPLLCPQCHDDLPALSLATCPVCAQPTPQGMTCGSCLKQPPWFDATVARFRYTFPVNHLIQGLKYRHQLALAPLLANALQKTATHLPPADLLLAVPLSRQRLAQRGFNQAVELARPLARANGLPLITEGYARTLDTVPQATLPWKERHGNIRGAFECARSLDGLRLIVVDDVMTTGASLNEFARTLKKRGAVHITNWVVARAYRE